MHAPLLRLAHNRTIAAHEVHNTTIVHILPLAGQPLQLRHLRREFRSIEQPRHEIAAKLRLEPTGIVRAGEVRHLDGARFGRIDGIVHAELVEMVVEVRRKLWKLGHEQRRAERHAVGRLNRAIVHLPVVPLRFGFDCIALLCDQFIPASGRGLRHIRLIEQGRAR
jgi:hypothetical protein